MAGHAWLDVLVGIAAALLLSWLALVITLAVGRPKGGLLKESLRLLPDLLRRRRAGLEDEPVLFDISAVNVRVAVIVRHRRTVLAKPGSPPGNPVKLPLEGKCAIQEKPVLLEVAKPPAPVLDRPECGTPNALHLWCAGGPMPPSWIHPSHRLSW